MDPRLGYESDAEDSFSEYKRSVRGEEKACHNLINACWRQSFNMECQVEEVMSRY